MAHPYYKGDLGATHKAVRVQHMSTLHTTGRTRYQYSYFSPRGHHQAKQEINKNNNNNNKNKNNTTKLSKLEIHLVCAGTRPLYEDRLRITSKISATVQFISQTIKYHSRWFRYREAIIFTIQQTKKHKSYTGVTISPI